jgi:hypothetical protein
MRPGDTPIYGVDRLEIFAYASMRNAMNKKQVGLFQLVIQNIIIYHF